MSSTMTTSLHDTPYGEAQMYYRGELEDHMAQFLERGYVYSDPTIFVMAYPYSSDLIRRRKFNKVIDNPDCWVIHFFAGEMKRLFEIAPMDLPYVAFERFKKGRSFKVYEVDKLKKRIV